MPPVVTDSPPPAAPSRPARWWQYEGRSRAAAVVAPAAGRGRAATRPPGRLAADWAQATRPERAVAASVLLLMVVYGPGLGIGQWPVENAAAVAVGLAGVPLLVARAVARRAGRPRGERLAAGLLLAWLLVGLVSALHMARPALGLVGLYGQSEGWLFMAALAGCWALGTVLRRHGRSLVAGALVAGAVANGVVAVGQVTVGLARWGLPVYSSGQPLGFQGDPVFLGGLEAGAVVLLAAAFLRGGSGRRAWAALAVVAAGTGAAGERMSMLVVAATAAWVVVAAWRAAGRRPTADDPSRPTVRQAVSFAASALGGMVVGTLLPLVSGSNLVAQKLKTSAEGTFGDRLHAWLEGLRAIAHQPILGAGPGQFESATSTLFPLWFVRSHPDQVFSDAHNLLVEYAVTTGLVGLACLIGWGVVAARGRRGMLLGFAAAALAVELVEPLNPVLTPLLFLAVGGAVAVRPSPHDRAGRAAPTAAVAPVGGAPAGRRRLLWAATGVCATVGVLLAAALVVGSRAMVDARNTVMTVGSRAAEGDATLGNTLLAPWPQSADGVAFVAAFGQARSPHAETPLALAAHWEQVAAGRDPNDGAAWAAAAQIQQQLGRTAEARADALVALRSSPWNTAALQILGDLALDRHDPAAARRWFTRLVRERPEPSLAVLMDSGCQANGIGAATSQQATGSCSP